MTPPPRRCPHLSLLGHSGATGTLSDRQNITRDAHENSWGSFQVVRDSIGVNDTGGRDFCADVLESTS